MHVQTGPGPDSASSEVPVAQDSRTSIAQLNRRVEAIKHAVTERLHQPDDCEDKRAEMASIEVGAHALWESREQPAVRCHPDRPRQPLEPGNYLLCSCIE